MQYGLLTFEEPKPDTSKKIIHIDMDAFYASVEIRENPELRNKPVIIARHPKDTNGRGVVTTASYEARKFGVHSAMSAQKAYELCPQAIFIPGRHDLYRQVSQEIHNIFHRYTDLVQPVSLDEAYLDITDNKLALDSATLIAQRIQRDIYQETQLTCSAGCSYNKFLAKLASDYKKPRGLTVIEPHQALDFLADLPIEDFHGVGHKSQERLHELGIHKGADLYEYSLFDLIDEFGKMGKLLYERVRGIDHSQVEVDRDRKSLGKEHTFAVPLKTEAQVFKELRELSQTVMQGLKRQKMHGKTVVLKIRNEAYETITRRKSFPNYIESEDELYAIAQDIWYESGSLNQGIRLLGVTVTSLDSHLFENIELPLWKKEEEQ